MRSAAHWPRRTRRSGGVAQDEPHTARGYIPALDGLRGVAILLVIASHYLGAHWRTATIGWTGVSLFFVLSGFLITSILLDEKNKPHYFRNFYARRTLRIFPLYYLVLTLVFVVAPLIPALNTEAYREVASRQAWVWTYTMNLYASFYSEIGQNPFAGDWLEMLHFWSLAVEEQFYLVWPLVVLFTTRRQLLGVCVVCILGAWGLRIYFAQEQLNTAPYFFTLCRVDDLAIGALIAAVAREKDGLEKLRSYAPWLTIIALWVLLGVTADQRHFFQLEATVQRYAYTAFGVLYGCLLIFALSAPASNWYRRAMEFAPLRSYGKYSYAIYIFHWALSVLLFEHIAPLGKLTEMSGSENAALVGRVVIVAAASWVIAFLSWHAYEKHFLKLKHRFYA